MDLSRICLSSLLLSLFLYGCSPEADDDDCANCIDDSESDETAAGEWPSALTLAANTATLSGTITDENEADLIEFALSPSADMYSSVLTGIVLAGNYSTGSNETAAVDCSSGSGSTESVSLDGDDYDLFLASYQAVTFSFDDCTLSAAGFEGTVYNGSGAYEILASGGSLAVKYSHDNWSIIRVISGEGVQSELRHGGYLLTFNSFTDSTTQKLDVVFRDNFAFGSGFFRVYSTTDIQKNGDADIYLSGAWSVVDGSGQRIDFLVSGDNSVAVTSRGVGMGDYEIDN